MDLKPPSYTINTKVWLWNGKGAWHFATIPNDIATQITAMFGYLKGGWGSLPVKLTIGDTSWQTSIFPDTKSGGYLIPLKSEIRKKEKINIGDEIQIKVELRT